MPINQDMYQRLKSLLIASGQLDSVVNAFVTNSATRLEDLRRFTGTKDIVEIAKIAHSIKGSCAMLGGTRCSEICSAIEDACKHANHEEIAHLLETLTAEIQSMAKFLENDRSTGSQGCCE